MKLKYTKFLKEEVTTDIDLPIYFYYQDCDSLTEEYIKWDGKKQVIVSLDYFNYSVSLSFFAPKNLESAIEYNLTTEKIFTKALKETLKSIKEEC